MMVDLLLQVRVGGGRRLARGESAPNLPTDATRELHLVEPSPPSILPTTTLSTTLLQQLSPSQRPMFTSSAVQLPPHRRIVTAHAPLPAAAAAEQLEPAVAIVFDDGKAGLTGGQVWHGPTPANETTQCVRSFNLALSASVPGRVG